ncbi:CvpA family protein [Paucibacter sp. AS339]|uniref:CvpA family protein n=1 Tax=Paucibacter hankyongi TaxID=3133434 RepID=UPI00309CF990
MNWIDWLLLGLMSVSLLLGLWRGLVFEVLSLAGWLVAYLASPVLAPWLEPWLPQEKLGASLAHMLGLVLAFVLVLLIWGLGAKLLRALLHASPLSVVDRLFGACFGLLRGLLICLALVLVVGMTPAIESQAWGASQLLPVLQSTLQVLRPLLPAELLQSVPGMA